MFFFNDPDAIGPGIGTDCGNALLSDILLLETPAPTPCFMRAVGLEAFIAEEEKSLESKEFFMAICEVEFFLDCMDFEKEDFVEEGIW